VADAMIADIPEAYQDIIPNTSPAETIKWIQRAKAKGLFNMAKVEDIPGSEAPKSSKSADFSSMSTEEKIKTGYKK
jgi:hypothetical protein